MIKQKNSSQLYKIWFLRNSREKKQFQKKDFIIGLKKNKYDWLLFFDVDEFLYINKNQA